MSARSNDARVSDRGKVDRTKLRKLRPLSQQSTPSIIGDQIRTLIMDGTFAPGEQLGEAQLAEGLNVSRGPIREALQRLVQEGLVENHRHRGAFVVSLDAADVRDIYAARLVIERMCVLSLAAKPADGVLSRLEKIVDQMAAASPSSRWGTLADLDLRFHSTLVEASGSKRLARMFATLVAETRMCLNELERAYPSPPAFVAEHREILEAVAACKPEEAARLLEVHLEDAVDQIVSAHE